MAASFFSFPILTRILSVGDYGILGIVMTTILVANAVGKFGLPAWIVQFYAEFKSKNQLNIFRSTMLISSFASAAIIALLFYGVSHLLLGTIFDKNISGLLPFISIIIFTTCTSITLTSFFRAEQRTKLYNLVNIINRYSSLTLGILLALFIVKGLYGFYFGQVLAGAMVLLVLIYMFNKNQKITSLTFSPMLFKDSVKYGFPLIWVEMGHLILNYADRYLIQLYLGSISLGIYVAGYNLSTYVTEIIMYPVNYALTPIYMNMLVNKGEEETKEFLGKAFRYFLLIMFPIVFGFIAVGKDLISILATRKYLGSVAVLPYVVIGQSIYACSLILNNGLYIRKKTYVVTSTIYFACLLNIGLNLVLIPHFGIIGAALATLISNTLYVILITYFAFKEFSFPIDYGRIVLYLGASVVMYHTVKWVHLNSSLINFIGEVLVGAFVYSLLVFLFDGEIRRNLLKFASTLKRG